MIALEPHFSVLRKSHPDYAPGSFMLMTPLVVHWKQKSVNVTVPAGFITNLASVPRLLRPMFPVNDNHRLASTFHDYLYMCGGRLVTAHEPGTEPVLPKGLGSRTLYYTRLEADEVFYQIMQIDGVATWRSRLMFWGVKRFGSRHWSVR